MMKESWMRSSCGAAALVVCGALASGVAMADPVRPASSDAIRRMIDHYGKPCAWAKPECPGGRVCFAYAPRCSCSPGLSDGVTPEWDLSCVRKDYLPEILRRSRVGYLWKGAWIPITARWPVVEEGRVDFTQESNPPSASGLKCEWDFDCAAGETCQCPSPPWFGQPGAGTCMSNKPPQPRPLCPAPPITPPNRKRKSQSPVAR